MCIQNHIKFKLMKTKETSYRLLREKIYKKKKKVKITGVS